MYVNSSLHLCEEVLSPYIHIYKHKEGRIEEGGRRNRWMDGWIMDGEGTQGGRVEGRAGRGREWEEDSHKQVSTISRKSILLSSQQPLWQPRQHEVLSGLDWSSGSINFTLCINSCTSWQTAAVVHSRPKYLMIAIHTDHIYKGSNSFFPTEWAPSHYAAISGCKDMICTALPAAPHVCCFTLLLVEQQ